MFSEDALPFYLFGVFLVCVIACPLCGILAARKGYNIFIWAIAGGVFLSFLILAFLPHLSEESTSNSKQLEKTGNWIGAALAAMSLLGLVFLFLDLVR